MSHTLCDEYEINEGEIQRRLEMLDFTAEDERRLEPVRGLIRENADYLTNEFYNHLLRFPELSRFIASQQRLSRLREALSRHLLTFGRNIASPQYFEDRLRIGATHEKNGILHKWYVAAHAHLWITLSRLVITRFGHEEAGELLISLQKLLGLEISLEVETYHRAALSRVELLMRQLEKGHDEIRRLSQTDSLTGILNRRQFLDQLESELHRCHRYGRPLCLLLLDLDDFKSINDQYGHQMGDTVLKAVASILLNQLRQVDFCGRLGGDEIAAALTETPLSTATLIADRIRLAIMQKEFTARDMRFSVGVSIGLAEPTPNVVDVAGLMCLVDESLYKAKNFGKGCSHTQTSQPEEMAGSI